MDVLILGGTGAMGSPLVQMLENKGNKVFVTTRVERKNRGNITYITGNARDISFLKTVCLEKRYAAIVDFMVYDLDEFEERYQFLLEATDQYVFLSSARVYANTDNKISENSPRLLDVCKDKNYLSTNEYALRKAREENFLMNSGKKNWTIIRPYITYNANRLQLGTLEKEHWLRRALMGKRFVITQNTMNSLTALTFGDDVAEAILNVIGNTKCYGEVFHIVNEETLTWAEILEIYLNTFEQVKGVRPEYQILEDYVGLATVLNNKYQMKYDRFYNRVFDSKKIDNCIGKRIKYTSMKKGLEECLRVFLKSPQFQGYDWRYEGYVDRITHDKTKIYDIPGTKNKIKYLIWRYMPLKLILKMKNN